MFFPTVKKPSRSEVQDQIEKVYPGAKVQSYQVSEYVPGQPLLHAESGMDKKGRKENQVDSTKKDANLRKRES